MEESSGQRFILQLFLNKKLNQFRVEAEELLL